MPIIETSDYLCALLTFIPFFYGFPTVLTGFYLILFSLRPCPHPLFQGNLPYCHLFAASCHFYDYVALNGCANLFLLSLCFLLEGENAIGSIHADEVVWLESLEDDGSESDSLDADV